MKTVILLVDDQPEVLLSWRRLLEPLGFDILESDSLASAKRMMLHIPPPDIILLDLNLPDSQGTATLAAINDFRALNPSCVILVLTGLMDESLRSIAALMGADAFATKMDTSQQETLWRAIQEAIERPSRFRDSPPFERSTELLERLSKIHE